MFDPYRITIGKFDHKLGPICVFASKSSNCILENGTLCNGFNCKLIKDAINVKEGKFVFDRSGLVYQGGKFKAENPEKRGGGERYIYIIKIPSRESQIKDDVITSFVSELKSEIETFHDDPGIDFFIEIKNKWEQKFNSILNPTQASDSKYYLRERLNTISLYIQLVLNNIKSIDKASEDILEEALKEIFEIDEYLSSTDNIKGNNSNLVH